jgi:hypothetical protein
VKPGKWENINRLQRRRSQGRQRGRASGRPDIRARRRLVIDARYKLAELPAARDHLDRGPFGKIVIELG